MSFLNSVMKSVRTRPFIAMSSALVMVAGMLFGANIATADSVWVQSYERTSQTEACAARPGETPWQASWGTDSSWSPSWEQWANSGKGGWVCTRSIMWAQSQVAEGSADPNCDVRLTYSVGDIGPGCGLVFLISGGKTYEMAPKTWSGGGGDPNDDWCSDVSNSVATGTAVGTGSVNTTAMLTNASPFVACTASAANAVRAYAGGGFTDWFLPSKDELNAMYSYKSSIIDPDFGFGSNFYWSSSQYNNVNAYVQSFANGSQSFSTKHGTLPIRPIRAF